MRNWRAVIGGPLTLWMYFRYGRLVTNAGHLLATLVSPAVPPVRRTKMRRRHLV
jgi:hypothetical protein